jgi:hypothetical protein
MFIHDNHSISYSTEKYSVSIHIELVLNRPRMLHTVETGRYKTRSGKHALFYKAVVEMK